ncbi:hypothetical protein [Aliidiomarina celeris]|uniref:hypothetical protein n=1 Tax=Aliidiomarina celeris TaxID=2249428 RepID=UPI000DEBFC6B|nr:hypothetical protein [Aliidiomarina celeris]
MDSNVLISIISASAAIIVAAFTYWATKQREREAEWRKEKLGHYKEYFAALAANVGAHSSHESSKRYAIAFNTVGLFASQEVISRLHNYQDLTCLPGEKVPRDEHDKRLTELVLAIRKDLKLKPKDDVSSFKYMVIESGKK